MEFKKIIILSLILFLSEVSMAAECVVLIHGFGRSSFSMGKISNHLESNGYKTISIDYPSRKHSIEFIVNQYIMPEINEDKLNCSKLHFVGYSMGGIITRYILANNRPSNVGRVVFLGTPNSGAEIVNSLGKYKWFKKVFGPAVQDLAVGAKFLNRLPKTVDYESGVISGNFSANPFTSFFLLKGDDDGTISVKSTIIKGMKDHIVIPSSHNMLLSNQRAVEEIEYFIRNGKFRPETSFDLLP